jgi:hypothetical protein
MHMQLEKTLWNDGEKINKWLRHEIWRTLMLLDGLNYESKDEDNERRRSWGALPSP